MPVIVFLLVSLVCVDSALANNQANDLLAGVESGDLAAAIDAVIAAVIARAGISEIILALIGLLWLLRRPIVRLTPTQADDRALDVAEEAIRTAGIEPVPLITRLIRWLRVGRGAR